MAQHSSLGLASQLHLAPNGVVTLCGVGVAWHAGTGSWPGIPANNGNAVTIGIEAAHNGTAAWSEAQYGAYLKVVRAINKRLGNPWNKVVAHKEYGAIQGKWDPGNLDMKLFRQRLLQAPDKPLVVMNMIELEAKENPWVGVRKAKPGAGGERKVGRDGKGRFVEYENAHIYFHPATGAHAIPHGGLFEAYAERKWETGELGFPVRDFTKLADGAVMAFQGGVLYRKDGKDHHVVKGVIGQRWALEGYEKGPLGWPTSDEISNGTGGKRQAFEHGVLEWDPSGAVKKIGDAAKDLTLVNAAGIPLAVEAVDLIAA
ncbi:N-acetylmuramoyl-L-alanine amidase [Gordonia westfalica]|uniref:N-acetylmuramoyl-L-alanine amidase n=1 Tax=Gordonia westfalica TaxID=158898 RepID=UPI003CC79E36